MRAFLVSGCGVLVTNPTDLFWRHGKLARTGNESGVHSHPRTPAPGGRRHAMTAHIRGRQRPAENAEAELSALIAQLIWARTMDDGKLMARGNVILSAAVM